MTLTVAVAVVVWAAVNLANGWAGFAIVIPTGFRGSGEAAISVGRLFAAGVLALIGAHGIGGRLRWVAYGFVVLGLGQLVFGYLAPMLDIGDDLNDSLYQMILVRTVAGALFVAGLLPKEPPRLSARTVAAVAVFCAVCMVGYTMFKEIDAVPTLVRIESLEAAAQLRIAPMSWMTGWHWLFAAIPFGLSAVAAIGADRRHREHEIGGWLPVALILLAGSELHDSLWPSAYMPSMLMTTADLLRLAMAAVVVVGGAVELKRLAAERAALLAAEKERSHRLEELATLKADFTAMVAHEFGHPLSAIRRLTEMLNRDGLDRGLRDQALTTILKETDALDRLVTDMQTTAVVERDDFTAMLRPVEVAELIQNAVVHAESHDPDRPLETAVAGLDPGTRVLADPDRIGQVLRNLLCNAAKYSPGDARIWLRAVAAGSDRVRLEVEDSGPGIHPDDVSRIFDKFGRGRNGAEGIISGAGIGLYLSQRIVRAHGSQITVRSRPGTGSVFAFELERVPAASRG